MKANRRQPKHIIVGSVIALVAVAGVLGLVLSHAATAALSLEVENGTLSNGASLVADSTASNAKAVKFMTPTPLPPPPPAAGCTVSATLVNSCRPWLGAWANTYPGHNNTGTRDQIANHESRLGRQVDWPHDYVNPGAVLSADDKYYMSRPGTTLLLNWRPSWVWKDAAGGNASVNTQIDAMANSIKSQSPHKILLIVFHEPEGAITKSTTSCAVASVTNTSGSAADYVAMWHNVRARFDALGVSNVVWGMNYMLYSGGTCIVKDLWPGNSYVDWVFADPYVNGTTPRPTYTARMDFTYGWLRDNSDVSHDFASKPWGWAEWGAQQMSQTQTYQVYDEAKAALDTNRYPNLKAYVVFDANTGPNGGGAVGMTGSGVADPVEQQHYNSFANDPIFKLQ